MNDIKVIIGSNYGDEGKGVTTSYICNKCNKPVLNVLYNGGMQRGHTVRDFVFHCFGAGTFEGADTYYDRSFMIDPIAWVIESNILNDYVSKNNIDINPLTITNINCAVVTPYHVAINQAIEHKRGINRHGSCGMGIFETYNRNKINKYKIIYSDLLNPYELYKKLCLIRDEYVPYRLSQLDLIDDNINYIDLITSIQIDQFMKCVNIFTRKVKCVNSLNDFCDETSEFANYHTIVFEAGQGLLLDMSRINESKHLTPSHTGLTNIVDWINSLSSDINVEVIYVTRSYITRHGNGNLQYSTNMNELGLSEGDKTNTYNDYQGNIRYGYLDVQSMLSRIDEDFSKLSRAAKKSLSITWLDKTDGLIRSANNSDYSNPKSLYNFFDRVYLDCYH